MKLETILDNLHSKITSNRLLQIFTAFTRLLLFIGFTPPSIKKIMNEPFTILPDSHPVGHYFNALYQTGFYYQFLGWAQLIAAILLIFPPTAHLGALMFLPIIANIAILTVSVGFKGTWLITILMTLAATYLVVWDYDRLKPILFYKRAENSNIFNRELVLLPIVFAVGGAVCGVIWYLIGLGNFSNYLKISLILSGLGLIFGFFVAVHHRFMNVGDLKKSSETLNIM